MLKRVIFACFSFLSLQTLAQTEIEWHETAIKRHQTNKKGMLILGSWAASNIILGTVVSLQTTGVDHYFYQMNAGWNLINLGIALPTLLKNYKAPLTFAENVKQQHLIEKILLLNIGLDAAYMIGGVYLNQLSVGNDQSQLLQGYGNSILLQGGFLMIFDCGLYLFHNRNGKQINKYLEKISLSNAGIGLKVNF
ncbi:MAG: DUF6992 family protein [Cytophagales bacterium]